MPAATPPISLLSERIIALENTFRKIQRERMNDVPILNTNIKVQAVGFQGWENSYLGVMITPWFMNLMLLSGDTEHWDELPELSKTSRNFPSGRYEFITGFESDIGKYQMCSLFSPMFEFQDHAAAFDTAEAIMRELMNEENNEPGDISSQQIENIWNGSEEKPEDPLPHTEAKEKETTATSTLAEKMEQPISRRQLLRGALMLDEE